MIQPWIVCPLVPVRPLWTAGGPDVHHEQQTIHNTYNSHNNKPNEQVAVESPQQHNAEYFSKRTPIHRFFKKSDKSIGRSTYSIVYLNYK